MKDPVPVTLMASCEAKTCGGKSLVFSIVIFGYPDYTACFFIKNILPAFPRHLSEVSTSHAANQMKCIGEKSYLHHILATAYHCMPSIIGSTIIHRWSVHTTIKAKIWQKGFSHIGTKSLELCPHDIRLEACTNSFKRKRKTFLFERYYC